jgi:hypothetical protein
MSRITEREEWYSRNAELPERPETKVKIAPKAKGELSQGFIKKDMPVQSEKDFHAQTKAERSSVGAAYKTDGKLHGKASPSSEESFVKPKASKETNAR